MRLLLDTHALIWWWENEPALSRAAHAAITEPGNEVFVSAATTWEIATKYRLGKLALDASVAADLGAEIARDGFAELPISVRHGEFAGAFVGAHKDPFDRMLVAQALLENMTLVSNERLFDGYGIQRLW